jgi:hypothetical protein
MASVNSDSVITVWFPDPWHLENRATLLNEDIAFTALPTPGIKPTSSLTAFHMPCAAVLHGSQFIAPADTASGTPLPTGVTVVPADAGHPKTIMPDAASAHMAHCALLPIIMSEPLTEKYEHSKLTSPA